MCARTLQGILLLTRTIGSPCNPFEDGTANNLTTTTSLQEGGGLVIEEPSFGSSFGQDLRVAEVM